MYYCRNCKIEFEEPKEEKTTYEGFYGIRTMFSDSHECTIKMCPNCDSDDFEEMKMCPICEEYCREDDLVDTDELPHGGIGDICPQCVIDCEVGC